MYSITEKLRDSYGMTKSKAKVLIEDGCFLCSLGIIGVKKPIAVKNHRRLYAFLKTTNGGCLTTDLPPQ
jgi:hypothetical protein